MLRRTWNIKDIVLNERAKASGLIDGTSHVDDVRTAISLVMRYDVQAAGVAPDEAADHTRQVMKARFPKIRPKQYEKSITYWEAHVGERPLVCIPGIPITKSELDVVAGRNGIRAQCIAFTLLAMAKYDTIRNPKVKYWVSGDRWNEIQERADLILSEDDMCEILRLMHNADLLGYAARVDNCSVQVLYHDDSGDAVMMLNDEDMRDLGYCYRAYIGEKYARCEECGRWIKQTKNGRRRFCKDCAADNQRSLNSAYMRRKRA